MRQDAVIELKCNFLEPGSWPGFFIRKNLSEAFDYKLTKPIL